MTTTQTEALSVVDTLKLALEALQEPLGFTGSREIDAKLKETIIAIKEALAQPEEEEKLHPVHIGVDVTKEGTAVTAFYRKPNAVMEMFYSQFHPLAQPEQEPVAIVHRNEYNEYRLEPHDNFDIKSIPFNVDVSLFKSPQRTAAEGEDTQRAWVGLTNQERQKIHFMWAGTGELTDEQDVINLVEEWLKEKNT